MCMLRTKQIFWSSKTDWDSAWSPDSVNGNLTRFAQSSNGNPTQDWSRLQGSFDLKGWIFCLCFKSIVPGCFIYGFPRQQAALVSSVRLECPGTLNGFWGFWVQHCCQYRVAFDWDETGWSNSASVREFTQAIDSVAVDHLPQVQHLQHLKTLL